MVRVVAPMVESPFVDSANDFFQVIAAASRVAAAGGVGFSIVALTFGLRRARRQLLSGSSCTAR